MFETTLSKKFNIQIGIIDIHKNSKNKLSTISNYQLSNIVKSNNTI